MSLDTLFQQILLTEQQLTEQTQKLKEVKVATIRCNEKIKCASENYEKTREDLDEKAQRLSAVRLQRDLAKKCKEQMLRQVEELLGQRRRLEEHLADMETKSKEEEEKFLVEISKFNRDFSLSGNGEAALQLQTQAELLELQREDDALRREMALMTQTNGRMSSVEAERRGLLQQLQRLDATQKDLDHQLSDARAAAASLRSERQAVSQKPLTDATCLRLKAELQVLKDGDLVEERDALRLEIRLLQAELDSSQVSERH